MKRIAVLLLLLLSLAVAEEVSVDRAAQIAATEYPELASSVPPASRPTQLAVTEDGEYWIIEFEDVWVPVKRDGTLLKEEEAEIVKAYQVHYALQKIIKQRDKNDYPVNQDTSLTLLLGDVENKETYLVSYQPQLPVELQDDATLLITDAQDLKSSINNALISILAVRARENEVLFNPASYSDFEDWRTDFEFMLDSFSMVATHGYAYNDARTQFNLEAQMFLNTSNNTAQKEIAQAFVSGIAIANIPGSLPGLESAVSQWKTNWLNIVLTDEKTQEGSEELYIKYGEIYSGQTVSILGQEAYTKVQSLATTVPVLVADLGSCLDDLNPEERRKLRELNETYGKASESYTKGANYERTLDENNARIEYLNAISWADDAEVLENELADLECPTATATPTPGGNILLDFITSFWGIVFIVLVVLLVGLYWWNNRKEEGYDETEYSYDY